jgi:serine/threonine protein kinase/Tol biopolymer transport system component
MSLYAGNRIGEYEVIALIGAGGMGEVYRARDTKLNRDVALKVLPAAFTSDVDRLARFEREAQVLALLNHPHVAAIYGLEESNGIRALVMELVEGPTLAERIDEQAMALEEALPVAKQIAEALEYAHEKGIIHRDLKPANVKLSADGNVKVLDFGLAKALEEQAPVGNSSVSPTLTLEGTRAGVILGTAAYMSPEQARGAAADKRADIWAFGCVLYEMLAGKSVFHGETTSDILAAVLKSEPDWSALGTTTPLAIRNLIRRCLVKDRKQRLQAIGEARIVLEESPSQAAPTEGPPAQRPIPWIAATAVATIALAVLALVHFREKPAVPELVRFPIPAPEKSTFFSGAYVSPDGRRIAFSASGPDGRNFLYIRALDSFESRPLAGTEGYLVPPLWSPDSRFIAFWVAGKLKKVEASGGPPQTLCDVAGVWRGGAWSREGVIIFGTASHGLMQVSDTGGAASPLTNLDSTRTESFHGWPTFLPDGRHFIYVRSSSDETSGLFLGSLDAKPEQQSFKRLVAAGSFAAYAPAKPGASNSSVGDILFVREGSLMAQAFDAQRLELSGEAVPIADELNDTGVPQFSVSTTGVLAYRAGGPGVGGPTTQLTWFDRTGKALGTVGEEGHYNTVALSPDGARVAFSRSGRQVHFLRGGGGLPYTDLWVHEFTRNTSTQLTFGAGVNWMAVWSSDGRRIVFASNRDGNFNLYQKDSSGAGKEDLLLKTGETKFPYDWSPDGRFVLFSSPVTPGQKSDLWFLPLTGDNRKPVLYLQTAASESKARFSPDGRFVAYTSDASGMNDVYVQPFPEASGGKWKIGSGYQPYWRRDGKELFYISTDSKLMAVDVTTNPAFKAGIPKALFPAPIWGPPMFVTRYDVTADGKKFLINTLRPEATGAASTPITVVLDWQAGLKK